MCLLLTSGTLMGCGGGEEPAAESGAGAAASTSQQLVAGVAWRWLRRRTALSHRTPVARWPVGCNPVLRVACRWGRWVDLRQRPAWAVQRLVRAVLRVKWRPELTVWLVELRDSRLRVAQAIAAHGGDVSKWSDEDMKNAVRQSDRRVIQAIDAG